MRFDRTGTAGLLLLLPLIAACAGEEVIEAGQGGDSATTTLSAETAAAPTTASTTPTVEAGATYPDGVTLYDTYKAWEGHELAPLVPSLEDLGPGWEHFYLTHYTEVPFFDPDRELESGASECGVTEPLVIRDGFFAEHGFGQSPDDALVMVTHGSPEQLQAFYDGLWALFLCPAQNETLGTEYEIKPAPELPGALDAIRFATDDDLGQHNEGVLVRRADLVYLLTISDQEDEGAEPIDFDPLAVELLINYDAQS